MRPGESPQTERLTRPTEPLPAGAVPPPPPHLHAGPNDLTLVGNAFAVTTSTPVPQRDRFPQLPGYAIQCELGRGGMGIVYRATQERLNRTVAVKMLLQHDSSDLSDVVRFRSEAEAVAAIPHPHVVKVYESDQHDGRPYFAMEYLSGGTLHARLRGRTPFEADEAAGLVEKLARAVHAAHSIGIVHRDLKPGNVLFDEHGEPRVTDFGLAKRTSQELTKTQAVMGTPAYMPPEQAAGRAKYVGPPADIYALGVILYECLTGSTPFACEDSLVLLNQVIADEPPSMRTKTPGVPRDLELICFKCLEKGPADRYQSAAELAEDLRRYSAREPVSVRPAGVIEKAVKWAKRRPTLAAAYGLGVLAAALLLFGGGAAVLAVQAAWARDDANRHWLATEEAREKLEQQADELVSARATAEGHQRTAEAAAGELAAQNAQTARALDSETQALAEANRLRAAAARTTYLHNVGFALREVQDGHFLRAQQLLDDCPPALRGWEWAHVHRTAHPEVGAGLCKFTAQDVVILPAAATAVTSHVSGGLVRFDLSQGKGAEVAAAEKPGVRFGTRLTADGSRALVVGVGKEKKDRVRLFDTRTGERLGGCDGPDDGLTAVNLSGDGSRGFVVFCGPVVCYDLKTFEVVGRTNTVCPGEARMEPSHDGAEIPLIVHDAVRVWDGKGDPGRPVATGSGRPTATALTDDHNRIVVGTSTGAVVFHDRTTGKAVTHLHAHAGTVSAVCVHTNAMAATGGEDGTVRVWELPAGRLLNTFAAHHDRVCALRFDDAGRHVVSADNAYAFRVFALSESERSRFPVVAGTPDGPHAADDRGRRVFVPDTDGKAGKVLTADMPGGVAVAGPKGQKMVVAAFAPKGKGLAVGGERGRVEWRDDPADPPALVGELRSPLQVFYFTPDGKRMLAQGVDEWLVWDVVARKVLRHERQTTSAAALSADGEHVAVGTSRDDPTSLHRFDIRVYPVGGGPGGGIASRDQVTAVVFSPDGKKVLAACGRKGIHEFARPTAGDSAPRDPLRSYIGHTAIVQCLAFHPDGTRLASGGIDGRVKVWDTETAVEAVGLAFATRDPVDMVRFSGDGRLLIATPLDRPPVVFDGHPPRFPAIRQQKFTALPEAKR